jgi:hydrogenase-4 membrane subunit HyfE
MSPDVVILCAAGMLLTAYLMVGQKSLFVTIRLYGLQSMLLGVVAVAMAVTDNQPHLLESAALTIGLKGVFVPWFLMRRSTGSASTGRSSPS